MLNNDAENQQNTLLAIIIPPLLIESPLAVVSLQSAQSIIQVTALEIVHISEGKDA